MSVIKRGGVWHLDFTVNGHRIRESTGARSKEAALKTQIVNCQGGLLARQEASIPRPLYLSHGGRVSLFARANDGYDVLSSRRSDRELPGLGHAEHLPTPGFVRVGRENGRRNTLAPAIRNYSGTSDSRGWHSDRSGTSRQGQHDSG